MADYETIKQEAFEEAIHEFESKNPMKAFLKRMLHQGHCIEDAKTLVSEHGCFECYNCIGDDCEIIKDLYRGDL